MRKNCILVGLLFTATAAFAGNGQQLVCSDGAYSFKTELGPSITSGAVEFNGHSIADGGLSCQLFQNPDDTGSSCRPSDTGCFIGSLHPAPSLPMFCASSNGAVKVNAGYSYDGLTAQIYAGSTDLDQKLLADLKCTVTAL